MLLRPDSGDSIEAVLMALHAAEKARLRGHDAVASQQLLHLVVAIALRQAPQS